MSAPDSYKIAKAFAQIDKHPAFPFLEEKWKLFAKKLSEKDAELSALPRKKYKSEFDKYVAVITRNTATTQSSFTKYQGFLNDAGKTRLGTLGYSESQIGKLYGSKKSKGSRDRILTESISADAVSIGQDGSLTTFESEEDVEYQPYYAAFLKVHPEFRGGGTKANVEFMIWMPKRWAEFYESIGWNPSHRFPDARQPEFEAWLTQYADTIVSAPAPAAPDYGATEEGLEEWVDSGPLEGEVGITTVCGPASDFGGESMCTLRVQEDAADDAYYLLEGPTGTQSFYDDPGARAQFLWTYWTDFVDTNRAYSAKQTQLWPATDVGAAPEAPVPAGDPLLEEELLAQTEPVSEELTTLAAAVVALAQEANRPSSFHFSELATEITAAGAPALAQQILKMLKLKKGMAVDPPDLGDRLATSLIKLGGGKYGLSGPILVKIGQAFRTSHPSSVMQAANGIYLSLQGLALWENPGDVKGDLELAVAHFELLEDVEARGLIFEFALAAALSLTSAGVFPLMPDRIIGVVRPVEPAGIVATGPDPESAAQEARNAERGIVVTPKPSVPPAPSPVKPNEEPSIATSSPSQGQLVELIAGVRGDSAKYLPLIAKTYVGYDDADTIKAAVEVWLKGLMSQPNNSFILRWTTAARDLDEVGSTVLTTTQQLSSAADGNQNPNSAMWRKVAIPVGRIQSQTRAYLEGYAIVKTLEQYEVEFAGASLQGPPQDTASGVPSALKTPYYYIAPDDDGVVAVHITADVMDSLLDSNAFTFGEHNPGDTLKTPFEYSVSNAFGQVTLREDGPRYLVGGASEEVMGFLVALEEYRLASCGSVTCVSAWLIDEAEEGEVTVEGMRQGATALISGWKNAFSSVLIAEVESVAFTKNKKGQFSARIKAGDEAYNLEVLVRAVPAASAPMVDYGVCVRVGGHDLFRFVASTTYSEFIRGIAVSLKVSEEAMAQGIEFGVAENVVTIPGDGLSSTDFSGILDELREDLQTQLQATQKAGLLLTNGGEKGGKQKPAPASQPRA